MKKSKLYIFGALMLSSLMMASCGSDYLDTLPTESVGKAAAIGSTENGYKVLNGIALTMTTQHYSWSQGCNGENRLIDIYENYMGQDFSYPQFASGWSPIMNGKYFPQSTSSYAAYPWTYYYNLIGQANSVIQNIDAATGSEGDKKFIKASALTFRAFAYEKLLHYYSVRWKDSNNGAADGLILRLDESIDAMPLSTMAEVYTQIYKDCSDAVALFTDSKLDRSSEQVWIPNLNVAHAVYARAALAREDYSTALEQAKLARKGYALMNNSDYAAGFMKPTSEWIFGSYGSASENTWYWSRGTQFACNGYYANNTEYGAGNISKQLTDQIPDNDVRKQLFLTVDKFPSYKNDTTDGYLQTYGLMAFMDYDDEGNEIKMPNDSLFDEVDSVVQAHAISGIDAPYQAGYYYVGAQLKFFCFDTPGVSYIPFIRSSEMLLIEAEANYFLNNEADAQAALVELNAKSGRNADYTCTKTGNELWTEIMNYRRLELWGEGQDWSDCKRWNIDIVRNTVEDGGNFHPSVAKTIAHNANDWKWSIPEAETNYNDKINDHSKTMK